MKYPTGCVFLYGCMFVFVCVCVVVPAGSSIEISVNVCFSLIDVSLAWINLELEVWLSWKPDDELSVCIQFMLHILVYLSWFTMFYMYLYVFICIHAAECHHICESAVIMRPTARLWLWYCFNATIKKKQTLKLSILHFTFTLSFYFTSVFQRCVTDSMLMMCSLVKHDMQCVNWVNDTSSLNLQTFFFFFFYSQFII